LGRTETFSETAQPLCQANPRSECDNDSKFEYSISVTNFLSSAVNEKSTAIFLFLVVMKNYDTLEVATEKLLALEIQASTWTIHSSSTLINLRQSTPPISIIEKYEHQK
jgi:hypothetical protein